jgi:hypothetical protein
MTTEITRFDLRHVCRSRLDGLATCCCMVSSSVSHLQWPVNPFFASYECTISQQYLSFLVICVLPIALNLHSVLFVSCSHLPGLLTNDLAFSYGLMARTSITPLLTHPLLLPTVTPHKSLVHSPSSMSSLCSLMMMMMMMMMKLYICFVSGRNRSPQSEGKQHDYLLLSITHLHSLPTPYSLVKLLLSQ